MEEGKGKGEGERGGCPGFAFEIYGHLRRRAWEVFPVESWRDVSVGMRLR